MLHFHNSFRRITAKFQSEKAQQATGPTTCSKQGQLRPKQGKQGPKAKASISLKEFTPFEAQSHVLSKSLGQLLMLVWQGAPVRSKLSCSQLSASLWLPTQPSSTREKVWPPYTQQPALEPLWSHYTGTIWAFPFSSLILKQISSWQLC